MATEATSKRKRLLEDSETSTSKKQEKRRKPDFSNPEDTVKFIVGKGPNPKPFVVHKEHACYYSMVLDAAFNSGFVEGQTQTYTLDDIGPRAFRLLVQWLYTQKLGVSIEMYEEAGDDEDPVELSETADLEELDENLEPSNPYATLKMSCDLVQLWMVADRLLIRPLQNAAIGILERLWIQKGHRVKDFAILFSYIYEHTTATSPLRHLLVDLIVYKWRMNEVIEEYPDLLPKDLLLEVVSILTMTLVPHQIRSHANGKKVWLQDKDGDPQYICTRVMRDYLVPEDGEDKDEDEATLEGDDQ